MSVRLHDELESVEERRAKAEDDASRAREKERETEGRRTAMQAEIDHLNDQVSTDGHQEKEKHMYRHKYTQSQKKSTVESCRRV